MSLTLSDAHKTNFETLLEAAHNGDVCLMSCVDRRTGGMVPVLCAVSRLEDGSVEMIPLGTLFTENPYEILDPPTH